MFGIESYTVILAIISITVHLVLHFVTPEFRAYSLYPPHITLKLYDASWIQLALESAFLKIGNTMMNLCFR